MTSSPAAKRRKCARQVNTHAVLAEDLLPAELWDMIMARAFPSTDDKTSYAHKVDRDRVRCTCRLFSGMFWRDVVTREYLGTMRTEGVAYTALDLGYDAGTDAKHDALCKNVLAYASVRDSLRELRNAVPALMRHVKAGSLHALTLYMSNERQAADFSRVTRALNANRVEDFTIRSANGALYERLFRLYFEPQDISLMTRIEGPAFMACKPVGGVFSLNTRLGVNESESIRAIRMESDTQWTLFEQRVASMVNLKHMDIIMGPFAAFYDVHPYHPTARVKTITQVTSVTLNSWKGGYLLPLFDNLTSLTWSNPLECEVDRFGNEFWRKFRKLKTLRLYDIERCSSALLKFDQDSAITEIVVQGNITSHPYYYAYGNLPCGLIKLTILNAHLKTAMCKGVLDLTMYTRLQYFRYGFYDDARSAIQSLCLPASVERCEYILSEPTHRRVDIEYIYQTPHCAHHVILCQQTRKTPRPRAFHAFRRKVLAMPFSRDGKHPLHELFLSDVRPVALTAFDSSINP